MLKRVYLCGPMSGHEAHNFPAFHAEAARLRGLGFNVVSPAELNPEPGKPWADCMKVDIKELVDCDSIVCLPGWEHSKGASLEVSIAWALGLDVFDSDQIQGRAS